MGIRPGDWLYKYVSAEGLLRILEQRTIRFTQPDYLNDPYESHLTLDRRSRGEIIKDAAKSWRDFHGELTIEAAENWAREREGMLLGTALEQYRRIRQELGILSLSETPDNLLLWAHYADEHRGAAIGLDFCHPSLIGEASDERQHTSFHRVRYADTKISGIPSPENVVRALTTKSECWKYEKEWRIVRTLNTLRHDKEKVYVADVSADAITHIVLGARFPRELGDRLMQAIGKPDLKHLQRDHALIAPHRFAVRIVSAEQYAGIRLHRDHHFGAVAEDALAFVPMIQDEAEIAPGEGSPPAAGEN
jgi:hypothetical protein